MKHTIWSNMNLDLDDWRSDIIEFHFDGNEEDASENEMTEIMYNTNADYLDDERANLGSIQLGKILVFDSLEFKYDDEIHHFDEVKSGKLADCLSSSEPLCEWFCEDGEMFYEGVNHDGRTYLLYRAFKENADFDAFLDLFYENKLTKEKLNQFTESLFPHIANVYGW